MGSTLSELHEQEMGVPQGSILSPALFSIKIDNIVKAVLKGTDCSFFVDDFALCVSGKTLNRVERAMQLCVNSVHKWVSENGFNFSTSNTVCIHFHQQYGFKTSCIVYGSAPQSVLKQLDPIHHQGFRIALGAFHASLAQRLYIEAHEPSLTTRRLKLSLK